MSDFTDRVAIVTGGASGIGKSLVHALHRAGARVVVADLNGAGAEATAAALGTRARAARVDVTDAAAVQALVDETERREGRVDLMFNNAGIALFADARDTDLADWNRIIDVNLRGVVHGVAAAYPGMVRRGSGHIVNTASVAGLVPTPSMIAYVASKHAVVGLSLTLRAEAARLGVRVTVVCPGLIETPIVQATKIVGPTRERLIADLPFKLHSPDRLAEAVLRGVKSNRAIVPFTAAARTSWLLHRLSPRASLALSSWFYGRSPFAQ
jgi:NAD(P)-dependent dehydrogenase (short-subunit alcohol dehydrogenase family)